MRSQQGVKAQDVLILLKIVSWRNRPWRANELAQELQISPAEVSMSLERSQKVGFLDGKKRNVLKAPLLEFLFHAIKYVFPSDLGPLCRGIPTAHSAAPLAKSIVSEDQDQYVWPHENGKVRGQSLQPLYKTAPSAAEKDPKLYELLALVDALRVGRARERNLAAKEIDARLTGLILESQ